MKYSSSNLPCICMQTNSTCYKQTRTMTVKGILWHCTGANNPTLKRYIQPAKNDANYTYLMDYLGKNTSGNDYNHASYQSGLNAWIGKTAKGNVAAVQTMPWNYRPWGCGSGSKGSCNNGWIQFEICEDSLTDSNYFNAVYQEACELTAYLCKIYNLDPYGYTYNNGVKVPVILCHQDSYRLGLGTNHGDIYNWFNRYGKTMDNVRNDVAALLKNTEEKIEVTEVNYQVEVTTEALNCRASYGTTYNIVTTYKKGTKLNISKEYNGWGYTGTGWVSLTYTKKITTTVPISEIKKKEEDIVTQEQFNQMMSVWIADSATKLPENWSAEARAWAEGLGLIMGDQNGNHSYKKFITREEFIMVLYRALNEEAFAKIMENYQAKLSKEEPSDWSEEARKWAENNNIILGDGQNKAYKKLITKEEVVALLERSKSK